MEDFGYSSLLSNLMIIINDFFDGIFLGRGDEYMDDYGLMKM